MKALQLLQPKCVAMDAPTYPRPDRLIRDFSRDDDIPPRDDSIPKPRQSQRNSLQSPDTQRHLREQDSWLDEESAQGPAVPRRARASIEQARQGGFDFDVHEPILDGVPEIPAMAVPRSRTPPATQQYQGLNFNEDSNHHPNGLRSHSPPAVQRYQTTSDQDSRMPPTASRQQDLNYDGDSTIKKHLGPKDTDSVAESEATTASSTRLANFFGQEVFQIILHNPTTSHQLKKFCQSRFCGENMEFLERIDRYNALIDELGTTMLDIHKNFISINAPSQLNLSNNVLTKVNKDLKSTLSSSLPKLESLFTSAQHHTEELVFTDVYPRFVRHQLVLSATKALAADRGKYAGLGDCFVLTNPAKADNPIVYASDGFVSVTGYTRRDIIPRNCRFLQGRHTSRESVTRLKTSIDNREESVELLLNYKKNKEPFWNLLYTAPLYDENGNVAFFIGGQINCSTTIHSASDILRVLSYSEDVDEKQDAPDPPPAPARRSTFGKSFFRSLRGDSINEINGNKEVGMENALLNRIDKLTIKKQMESFQSAYSKVRKPSLARFHANPRSTLWLNTTP